MADVPYLNSGDQVTSEEWNALYEEMDKRLSYNYGRLSILLWLADQAPFQPNNPLVNGFYKRSFWFMPRYTRTSMWSSVAEKVWSSSPLGNPQFSLGIWDKRIYDHQVFVDLINSLNVAKQLPGETRPVTDDEPVVRLDLGMYWGDFNSLWSPRIWSGWPQYGTDAMRAMDYSLEAHQRTVNGQKYFVYLDTQGIGGSFGGDRPAHISKYTPVEIVLGDQGSNFDFPDNYNRFNVFRFHNIQGQPINVSFGANFSFSIEANSCRCVRRTAVNGTYTVGYRYFQKFLDGDPWFWTWLGIHKMTNEIPSLNENAQNCNLTDIMHGVYLMAGLAYRDLALSIVNAGAIGSAGFYDYAKLWDPSAIYNNPGYVARSHERAAPSGGYFAPISGSAKLGDALVNKGEMMLVVGAFSKLTVTNTMKGVSVTNAPTETMLLKRDNSPAIGITNFTVERVNPDQSLTAIPELSGGVDRNWLLGHHDASGSPISWYVIFSPRSVGAAPMLAFGQTVQLTFKHQTDDNKYVFEFTGMSSLQKAFEDAGMVYGPAPIDPQLVGSGVGRFQVTRAPAADLVDVSSNMLHLLIGAPATSVGAGTTQSPALIFPTVIVDQPFMGAWNRVSTPINAQWQVYTFTPSTTGGWGNYTFDHTETVSTVNDTVQEYFDPNPPAPRLKPFSLHETIGDVIAWMQTLAHPSMLSTFGVANAVFGPCITVEQRIGGDIAMLYTGSWFTSANSQDSGTEWTLDTTFAQVSWYRRFYMPIVGNTSSIGYNTIHLEKGHWPSFSGPGGGLVTNSWHQRGGGLGVGTLKWCYPRTNRYWQNRRFFQAPSRTVTPTKADGTGQGTPFQTTKFAWGGGGSSEENPLVKSYYESAPMEPDKLVPVAQAPMNLVPGIALMGPFVDDVDIYARLGNWIKYGSLRFTTGPGSFGLYDFAAKSALQVSYWTGMRNNIVVSGGATAGEDGNMRTALPLEVEHYNTAASVVNIITRTKSGGGYRCNDHIFLIGDNLRTWFNGGGQSNPYYLGPLMVNNARPRSQWTAWKHSLNPDATSWCQNKGITVGTGNDLPVLPLLLTKRNAWLWYEDLSGNIYSSEATSTNPANPGYQPLLNWYSGHLFQGGISVAGLTALLNDYRWITIAEAQKLHTALGLPFLHEELVVPLKLRIEDATWSSVGGWNQTANGGVPLPIPPHNTGISTRAVGFFNDPDGEWVMDDPSGGWIVSDPSAQMDIVREVNPITSIDAANNKYTIAHTLLKFGFGGLEAGFRGGDGTPQVRFDNANAFYLCRNYNGVRKQAITFAKNQIDWQRGFIANPVNFYAGSSNIIPRIVRNCEPGIEVTPCSAEETIIQTQFPGGTLVIQRVEHDWPTGRQTAEP